ncbi:PREDICTED: putative uncharacterized protein DDB_G0292292 [Cyphomyrmex costatus]|uniref:putative uncharacterized protein DDB_G0292292 n=1 Tax=Cyphomyrmex costatus TaxID=456900 RepID=UPI0008523E14|nr:PREDICTED: putative uncharacterized protein DDB_G0292292 [Cyphomyrmex costatus]
MARSSNDVSRAVCANAIQENDRRLREARTKNQGKDRIKHDLNKLFGKLNQAVEASLLKSLDKSSPSYNKNASRCWYGPVLGFPPGSWWGIRMDCARDKMHEPFNVDIHEGPFGVISVCTSHTNMNEDVDYGDYLTLTGQVYHKEQPSADPLICNYKNQIPLRLIRSYNLQNNIAPNTGYRYDGLYIVISCWIGMTSDGTKYNKFALMRLANQESPSWSSKNSEELSSMRHHIPLSNHLNTYDLRKCSNNIGVTCRKRKLSYGDSCESLPAAKTIPSVDTSRRSVPESSIVTRHVFKKLPNNVENAISTSVPDQKTLLCLGSSSKPIDITVRTALDMEGSRLTPKEDTKLIEKINMDKARVNSRPSENLSYNGHVVVDNTNTSLLNKRRENLPSLAVQSSEHSYAYISSSLDSPKNTIERKEQLQNAQCQDVQNLNINNEPIQKSNSRDESPRNSVATHERISECHDALEISNESLCAQNIKSLDSLTPDKILNLINKEIHHPMSKLLIGNMIGLTIEECAMWNTPKRETTPEIKNKKHVSTNINLRKKREETDNIKENVASLDNRRYCKYSKSKRLIWKVTKQADGKKFDNLLPSTDRQSCNDVDQKRNNNVRRSDRNCISKKNNEYLSPFRVQSSLQTIAQHTRSSYDIKTRLRTDKKVLVKPKFPDSSIKKTKYKKRDREIANLSIDANFGPATRGPRNRRLRCKNNAFAKCNTFNTVVYSSNKRYKSSFKRKSKLTKVSRQRAGERQTKNKYSLTNTVHANSKNINSSIEKQKNLRSNVSNNNNNENRNNHSNNSVSNKKKENETVTADHNIITITFDRSLRNKPTRTIPLSHYGTQPRLSCFRKKQDEKPSTVDATTQCRLISDNPEVYVIGQLNDQRAILKMEWDKLEKLKESMLDVCDQGSQVQTLRVCTASTHTEDNASRKSDEEYADSLQDRTSAFVPVNAFDSDLRIARLRSIGFKPIINPQSPLAAHDLEIIQNAFVTTSKVTKRDVAEEYHKYANEDTNAVVYMDDELQYQDIEEEEEEDEKQLTANTSLKSTFREVQLKTGNVFPETLSLRENLESPWHGWKKIVTNNQSYWIGW